MENNRKVLSDTRIRYLIPIQVNQVLQGKMTRFADTPHANATNYPDILKPEIKRFSIKKISSRMSWNSTKPTLTNCEGVMATLKGRPLSATLAEEALHTLANLCRFDDDNRYKLGLAGACQVVAQVIRMYPANEFTMAQALYVVHSLTMHPSNAQRLASGGVMEDVITAMNRHLQSNSAISFHGCGAIWNFALNKDLKKRLGDNDACGAVLAAMSTYIHSDVSICQEGCGAVWNLAMGCESNLLKLCEGGVCELINDILRIHGTLNASVCQYCCGAIMEISTLNMSTKALLGSLGVCWEVVKVFSEHASHHSGVAEFGCRAMMNLAMDHNTNKVYLGNCGACEELTKWLFENYDIFPNCVVYACGAIMNIASGCDRNKVKFGACGVCPIIVKVIVKYAMINDKEDVIQMALGVVKNLASHPPNKVAFNKTSELRNTVKNISIDSNAGRNVKQWALDVLKSI